MGKKKKRSQMLRDPGIPDTSARLRYVRQLVDQRDAEDETVVQSADDTFLTSAILPDVDFWQRIDAHTRRIRDSMRQMNAALQEVRAAPPPLIASGGWSAPAELVYELATPFDVSGYDWDAGRYRTDRLHHLKGDEVPLEALRPGTKVYVLEEVFTVDRVELDPIRTVWLKELPTSPLYFEGWEDINLAIEEEE